MVGTGGVYGRLGVVRELAWPLRSAPESRTDLHEELRFCNEAVNSELTCSQLRVEVYSHLF